MFTGVRRLVGIAAIWLMLMAVSLMNAAYGSQAPTVGVLAPISSGLMNPIRVAVDGQGNMYVTDLVAGGIVKYDLYGGVLGVVKTAMSPQGVAVTADGRLVVSQGDHVSILDQTGVELGELGQGAGQFKSASGIAIDGNGYIYVVDTAGYCVQVFTASGQYVTRFGAYGTSAGYFNKPTGIAYDKVNKLLVVADTFNARLQFFDTISYAWKKTIGTLGTTDPNYPTTIKFTAPQGISFQYSTDPTSGLPVTSRMYVVDSFQSCVQIIDPTGTGTFLAYIGSYGYGLGQFTVPTDIAYDPVTQRLFVLSGYGTINLFGIDGGPILPLQ